MCGGISHSDRSTDTTGRPLHWSPEHLAQRPLASCHLFSSLHFHHPSPQPPDGARKSKHSHHEEDAPGVRDAASFSWGGMAVIATRATHQAQVIKNHHECQQTADNQATQPPGEASTVLLYIKEVDVLITQKLSG